MTEMVVKKLEEAFSMGCTDTEACLVAGISRTTYYAYVKQNPEFVDRKEALLRSPSYRARKVVVDAIDSGDKDTAKWYLERKEKDEFSTKTNTQLGNDPQNPLDWNVTVNIPDANKY